LSSPQRRKGPRKAAVAIRYDREAMPAPRVIAKGKGVIAERLIVLARQNGIPIIEDELLVEALDQLNLNQEIPGELYQVVAEILVAIYKTETRARKKSS
jgi:flagellar biosynthesis protein